VLLLTALVAFAVAQHWETELVDSVAGNISLRAGISRDGRVHACYCATAGLFRYAWYDTGWHREEFTAEVYGWDFAVSPSGQAGLLGLRYPANDSFVLSERSDTGWASSIIPVTKGSGYSLVYDTFEKPAMAYYYEGYQSWYVSWYVDYARRTDTGWASLHLRSGGYYTFCNGLSDLQVNTRNSHAAVIYASDNSHIPTSDAHVSVQDDSGGWHVYLAAHRGTAPYGVSAWAVAPFCSTRAAACYSVGPSLESLFCGTHLVTTAQVSRVAVRVDSLDQERLVYQTSDKLIYTWRDGATWSEETVMDGGVASLGGFVLDQADNPIVAFLDSSGRPWLARRVFSEHDVGVAAIVAPAETVGQGSIVTPKVVVKNYGLQSESPAVVLFIEPGYADIALVGNLAPGESDTVSLDNWVASDTEAVYSAQCFTIMPGDEWPANDTVSRAVVVHGVGVTEGSAGRVHVGARATVVRGVLVLPTSSARREVSGVLLDVTGKRVLDLVSGTNDVSMLPPGVYFVRGGPQATSLKPQAVSKVVIAR